MFYDLKDIVDLTGVVVKPRTLAERSPIQASAGLPFVVASWEQILFPCFHSSLGTNFPQSQPLVKAYQFGISPLNCSESDAQKLIISVTSCKMDHYWIATTRRPLKDSDFFLTFFGTVPIPVQ